MGIPGIYKHIGPGERIALSKLAVEHLENTGRPLRIAIDISIWQFQILSGQGGKNPSLRTLYYRLLRLLALSIQPLFVFDGPHKPPFKRGKKIAPGGASLPDFLTKELLKRFGFPYHTAPGEAEAECASFQKEGLVDAVLSEDVDTLMFGCTLSLRSWSAEGVRGNKSPTHVNIYRADVTKQQAGLDSEGMILVALMSGGDYIPAGVPGCGPKTAYEAAKAGFGQDLCKITKGDATALEGWRQRLTHELHTNENRFFRQKHKAMTIPENFPNMQVLGYYTHPTISSKEKVSKLQNEIDWSQDINVKELRIFVADAFNWSFLPGAKKFIRGLAPALLAHQLVKRSNSDARDEESLEVKKAAEAQLVSTVCDRRSHWNTDGVPELRIAYIPNDLVGVDLSLEEVEDFQSQSGSEEEQPASGDEEIRNRSRSPTKGRGPSMYDPTVVEKIWVLETFVKLGVPVLVETWEEDMRNPNKFASRKARAKKTISRAQTTTKAGTMDEFFKVAKPRSTQGPAKADFLQETTVDEAPCTVLAPVKANPLGSPQRKALSENRKLVGQKTTQKDASPPKRKTLRTKALPSASQILSLPLNDKADNPWTLSKRPSDTLRFRSPTRYSALGIYAPGDPEYEDTNPKTVTSTHDIMQNLVSPPASPTPRKRRSRPTTPVSDADVTVLPNQSSIFERLTDTARRLEPSTPTMQDPTKPSPRKKRSPLEVANELYLTGQLRTPVSMRKEIGLAHLVSLDDDEPLTARKVNRKLDFTKHQTVSRTDSPASDTSSLPSPSALMSPQARKKPDPATVEAVVSMEKPSSPVKENKVRRLVALRESLEGAWKHMEPWESTARAVKTVYSKVEVVDLTGG